MTRLKNRRISKPSHGELEYVTTCRSVVLVKESLIRYANEASVTVIRQFGKDTLL